MSDVRPQVMSQMRVKHLQYLHGGCGGFVCPKSVASDKLILFEKFSEFCTDAFCERDKFPV